MHNVMVSVCNNKLSHITVILKASHLLYREKGNETYQARAVMRGTDIYRPNEGLLPNL